MTVEVGSGQHPKAIRDTVRDSHFSNQGFKTLRFWNDEVVKNLDGVCLTILHEARGLARG